VWGAEFAADGVPASDIAKGVDDFYRASFDNLVGVLAARTPPPPPTERRGKRGSGRRKSDPTGATKRR